MSRSDPRSGGCLCGAVRFTVTGAGTGIDACHCAMCRRWTGGVEFGLSVTESAVVWQGGDAIRRYQSSDWAERGFCGVCGSHLFYRLTGEGADHLSLLPGTLDAQDDLRLQLEIFIDRKPPGYALAGDHERLTEAETMARFAPEAEA